MSSHTSVDTPSNKINRGTRYGKKYNRNRQRFRTPTCFACGNPNHRIKDCNDEAKKDAWIAKRQEKKNEKASPVTSKTTHQNSPKTEYASMAKLHVSKTAVTNLTDEELATFTEAFRELLQQNIEVQKYPNSIHKHKFIPLLMKRMISSHW